ncbi:MAG: hypothetical protein HY700_00800 [Gemmatimonadetes bacterium]|nr:hypothetical protein [Gemmatimonadota bacterium]
MRRAWLVALGLFGTPLWAQNQAPQRQALMEQISERFMENFRQQAALTPEQNQRFRAVTQRSFQERRIRQEKEQELWRALEFQMRPGVAAAPDSVSKLLDGIVAIRSANIEAMRADQKEYATFLSPVQRAQLFLQFERLQRSIEEMIQRRMQRSGMQQVPQPPPN